MDQHPRPPWTRRLTRRQLVAADVLVALLLVPLLCSAAFVGRVDAALPMPVGYALAVVLPATVALRRWRPWPALGVALAASAVSVLAGFTKDPLLAPALTLYVVAAVSSSRSGMVALLVTELSVAVTATLSWLLPGGSSHDPASASRVLIAAVIQLAAWLLGKMIATQRSYTELVRQHGQRQTQEQVALAQARAEGAVAEERLRIAQELHDVVAHSMSVIAVQAGVGLHVAAQQPEEAARALAAIEGSSRDTLREMRRLLGVLRGPDELLPAPGLADLPALLSATRQTGLQVELRVDGGPRELPAGIELAAYRIVQEALTNVVKHAGTDRGDVLVRYEPRALCVEVTDEGIGSRAGVGTGHGVIGMRERVSLYGGQFTAQPLPVRGFRVAARLPIGDPE